MARVVRFLLREENGERTCCCLVALDFEVESQRKDVKTCSVVLQN